MNRWFGALTALALMTTTSSGQIGGTGADGPFEPQASTLLGTHVNGGVFDFAFIRIRAGVTVRLVGPNPAAFLSQGDVTIDGELDADADSIFAGHRGNLCVGSQADLDREAQSWCVLTTLLPGIDPLAGFDFPVPRDPQLRGVTFYSQMFNGLYTATGRSRVSNLLASQVQ
ncbi:MAG: hypothetical protein AAF628_32750 [Planctomycetota bacterium]